VVPGVKAWLNILFSFFLPCDTQKIPTGYMGLKSIKKKRDCGALPKSFKLNCGWQSTNFPQILSLELGISKFV